MGLGWKPLHFYANNHSYVIATLYELSKGTFDHYWNRWIYYGGEGWAGELWMNMLIVQ